MSFRFHIKNYRGRFHILIGLRMFHGLRSEDFIRYTDSAFQQRFPIDNDYEHEQQAQYALSDLKQSLARR